MIICGIVQMAFSTGFSDKTDVAYKDSANLIMEAMVNIRTVSSFGYENIIAKKYDEKMKEPYRLAIKKGNLSGFFFGLSQIVMFVIFGVLFYLGALFVNDYPKEVTVDRMFTAIYAIMFAGMTAGNNAHFMPDTAACKNSAANLFEIQDSEDEEQRQVKENSKLLKSGGDGDIVLENVDFKYESRNEYVFEKMSLMVRKGTKVAFVGTSGCGKSTIIQLLQRFYFP
jgi:ATP-binding cassette subfamily B (MDR/TAP) protein 1